MGAWFRPAPSLEFGLAGQVVPANIVTHSTLDAHRPRSDARWARSARRGTATPANDVTVKLPLPLLVRGGARYRHLAGGRELFDLELDVEYETWSRAKAFTVESNGLVATPLEASTSPIGTITVPKQWNDVLSVKLGGDFNLVPERWTLRAGVYYETAASPSAYANVDFPGRRAARAGRSARRCCCSRWRWPSPISCAINRASPSRRRTPASTSRRPAAPAPPPTPTEQLQRPLSGQPHRVNAGTYAATSHLVSLAVVYRYGR